MISFVSALSVIENEEDRARAGNIFDQYQNAMYWTAHDILKNRSDAEDAVMEAARSIMMISTFTEKHLLHGGAAYLMPEWAMVFMTLLWQRMNKIRLGRNIISDDAAAMPCPATELVLLESVLI